MIPLHKLPIEIFVQVITEALSSFQIRQERGPTHLGRIVTLCQVCKRWKDVINRTASLWATIDIRDPTVVISIALSRSANHPLNLIGAPRSGPFKNWYGIPRGWEEFVKTAIAHSTRWRSVQLAVGSSEAALAVMNARAPRLQSLEVYSWAESRVDTQKGGSIFQTTGPRLRRLGLRGLAIPSGWGSGVLHDLRYLTISSFYGLAPSCEEMLATLRECPMLVELMLSLDLTANVETSWKGPSFMLAQLESISISSLSTSWALALLETIRTPSVQLVDLSLDLLNSNHLFPSVIKRLGPIFSDIIDAQYQLHIHIDTDHLEWLCEPTGEPSNGRTVNIKVRNKPASETLETIWAEMGSNRFDLESISIYFNPEADFSLFLPKLDRMQPITSVSFDWCDLDPVFTYMSNPTTRSEWGFPELEYFTIRGCTYDPPRLLEMVLARYEGEGSEGSDISDNKRDRPPPFKDLTIHHAPGEADVETLDMVEDIVGYDCFTLEEDLEE
ncbi:hypothetical protein FRC00_001251 [Tulasnella sp. 408]|nr:hypothetical protein FRC00_001251 [Tulasnella sp. 408]